MRGRTRKLDRRPKRLRAGYKIEKNKFYSIGWYRDSRGRLKRAYAHPHAVGIFYSNRRGKIVRMAKHLQKRVAVDHTMV